MLCPFPVVLVRLSGAEDDPSLSHRKGKKRRKEGIESQRGALAYSGCIEHLLCA